MLRKHFIRRNFNRTHAESLDSREQSDVPFRRRARLGRDLGLCGPDRNTAVLCRGGNARAIGRKRYRGHNFLVMPRAVVNVALRVREQSSDQLARLRVENGRRAAVVDSVIIIINLVRRSEERAVA
jgi:hypothetical protein